MLVCKISPRIQCFIRLQKYNNNSKPPNIMPENINKIIKSILRDIQVEMTDEFDQNFEWQAFFSEAWQRRKSPARDEGRAILTDTGQLRRSIKSRTTDTSVIFYIDLPYAAIHNDGGEIVVTQRMKRFFWVLNGSNTGGIKQRFTYQLWFWIIGAWTTFC